MFEKIKKGVKKIMNRIEQNNVNMIYVKKENMEQIKNMTVDIIKDKDLRKTVGKIIIFSGLGISIIGFGIAYS